MELRVASGSLLVSVPQMLDPNFMHTVVLICEHGSDGAVGLVVNRSPSTRICDLLPDHPTFSKLDFPVHQGGPVGLDTLQFIHTAGDSIPGGLTLPGGLCMGGEMEALAGYLSGAERPERRVRIFLGYAGWGGGQLEDELQTGSWVPAPADKDLLFSDASAEEIWRSSLRSLGAAGENLSQLPPDVSWN